MGQVLKLLLLTGCRRTELAGMRRCDDGTFVIPSSRTKNKRPHVVPLPAPARGIIASVKLFEGPERSSIHDQ
jgi:integrase